MIVQLLWEDESEKAAVQRANTDWLLFGELHITNANGLTVLDPSGITYKPTGRELSVLASSRIDRLSSRLTEKIDS